MTYTDTERRRAQHNTLKTLRNKYFRLTDMGKGQKKLKNRKKTPAGGAHKNNDGPHKYFFNPCIFLLTNLTGLVILYIDDANKKTGGQGNDKIQCGRNKTGRDRYWS